jgi:uncharacterized protein (DUF885 family)
VRRRRHAAFAAVSTAAVLAALSLATGAPRTPSSRTVAEVGEAYLDFLKQDSLYLRMKFGLPIERLPDVSLAKEETDARLAARWLTRLGEVRPGDLTEDETLSLDILRHQLGAVRDTPHFHGLGFLVTPYASPFALVNRAFSTFAIPDEAAATRYLALLRQLPVFVGAVRAELEAQATHGIRIPKDELALAVPFVSSLAGDTRSSPYAVGADRVSALPPAAAAAFGEQVAAVIEKEVNPRVRSLADWLGADYRAQAPDAVGLGQYPGGPEYYAWLVRLHTTMEVTPAQVHQIGLERVAAIDAEMKKVRDRLGFQGTKAEFKAQLKKDPRLFPRTPEEIGERLMAHVRRIEPKVDAFFLRRPRAPYGVRRLEPQLEPGQTFGYYNPPTRTEPVGYYYFNGSNLADRSLLNAGALIYHELVPGHHFQINLAYENLSIPPFRRETTDTAYTEGWGEYASALAGEMGMYEDPYDLYGRLSMEMFIALRLVVDTGMNALGWPRARALELMRENLMETDTQIATESLRYSCDIPGQALAYKMGAIEILRLREKARAELGPRFDIRRFHEAVLGSGSLPMTTLARHVDWFIAQEKKR